MPRGHSKPQPMHVPAAVLDAAIACISVLNVDELRMMWRETHGAHAPDGLSKDLLGRALAYRLQEKALGGLAPQTLRVLRLMTNAGAELPRHIKVGSLIVREFDGNTHKVVVVPGGFCWRGKTWSSLSAIAREITGSSWNGPRFFGLREKRQAEANGRKTDGDDKAAPPKRAGRRSSLRTNTNDGHGRGNTPGNGEPSNPGVSS